MGSDTLGPEAEARAQAVLVHPVHDMVLPGPSSSPMDGPPTCELNRAAITITNPIRAIAKDQGVTTNNTPLHLTVDPFITTAIQTPPTPILTKMGLHTATFRKGQSAAFMGSQAPLAPNLRVVMVP